MSNVYKETSYSMCILLNILLSPEYSYEQTEKLCDISLYNSELSYISTSMPTLKEYSSMDKTTLQHQYLVYTKEILPHLARQHKWIVHFDHCFQRIILDNLFHMPWYNAVQERPAYKHLTDEQLAQALELAKEIEQKGNHYLILLNENSLHWRGKLKR